MAIIIVPQQLLKRIHFRYAVTTGIVRGFNNAWIGRDSRTNNTPLNGTISAVRIYNRTLSSEEVNSNYLEDKARFGF